MNCKRLPAILAGLIAVLTLAAQEAPKYGISISGFLKTDYFFDTRDGVSIREGHFLLFPKERLTDANGVDVNAKSSFNFLSIQSRLTGKITAPDAFGAKVTGIVEADFFGNESAAFVDANGLRLRHAYAKLNWENTELIAGQFWHPFFIPACFSGVVSFNTGAPFQPFSRNPQARLTYRAGNLSFTGVMAAQRDFASPGGSSALRYSAVPDITALVTLENRDAEAKTELVTGAAVNYKSLQPLLTTTRLGQSYVTDEKVRGLSATAFLKIGKPEFTYKLQAIYGQNLFDHVMLGGYVVSTLADPATNRVTYSTLNTMTVWTEFQPTGNKIQYGLWGGYSQNLGSRSPVLVYSNRIGGSDITTRGANMKSVMRVSPRVVFIQGKFNFATELEYTSVAYATSQGDGTINRNEFGVVTDTYSVGNLRILLAAILNF